MYFLNLFLSFLLDARLELSRAEKNQFEVFSVAVGYQRFGGLHPEDGGSKVLRNFGILLPQHNTKIST